MTRQELLDKNPELTAALSKKLKDVIFVRVCQECGNEQVSKPPYKYKDQNKQAWLNVTCKKCKNKDLNYSYNKLRYKLTAKEASLYEALNELDYH